MSTPVAVAEIKLSEEERLRIAKDLGLDESQLDAIPKKLDIAKYEVEDADDDEVTGFVFDTSALQIHKWGAGGQFNAAALSPQLKQGITPRWVIVAV